MNQALYAHMNNKRKMKKKKKEMFGILIHKENAIRNSTEIPTHSSHNGFHQESNNKKCW
jgi:hypothetical protein